MFILPEAFRALAEWRQFIVFRLVASATRPGKTDKLPTHPHTHLTHDAHDPAIWMDVETAAAYAASFGEDYGVGFVFTPNDPFFFIDIDNCLEGDKWSATANALLIRFAGCAVEISASGRGLHIIGTGAIGAGPPPPARKVKYGQWFELYTENRFCALTANSVLGDAKTDCALALRTLVAEYLTPEKTVDVGWTQSPCAEWRGPTDDQELIRRMMISRSMPQALGHKAAFADLYMGDADKLRTFWPDNTHAEGYDSSSADMALVTALAFWTGNDCERMKRIMLTSALKRDKWDREDYVNRTILAGASRQFQFLQDKPPQEQVIGQSSTEVTGNTFLNAGEQIELFKNCVYIADRTRVLVPGGKLFKPDQFRYAYDGYSFPIDIHQKISRNAFEVFTGSQLVRFPRADNITFRPDLEPCVIIKENGTTLANIWWPINTPCEPGDAGPFLQHLEKLFPNEDDRQKLLSYIAAVIQYPGVKFQWAPFIQGVEGNGKTFILTALARSVGERYYHFPNAQDIAGNGNKFNAWLERKLFIGIEEIYTGDRRELLDVLKPLITNSRLEIQAKGADQITGGNCANFIVTSNHKDAIPKNVNDRRWAIFFCAQQDVADLKRDGINGNYMPELWRWAEEGGFAFVHHYLKNFKIPTALNPAFAMHRAPETSNMLEALGLGLGRIEQEIIEAVEQEQPGFAGGWVSTMALDRLLHRIQAQRHIPPRKRRELLQGLNYIPHPALPEGRVTHSIEPDNGRTRLYVRPGHLSLNLTTPATVAKAYTDAQTRALSSKANFGVDGAGNKA